MTYLYLFCVEVKWLYVDLLGSVDQQLQVYPCCAVMLQALQPVLNCPSAAPVHPCCAVLLNALQPVLNCPSATPGASVLFCVAERLTTSVKLSSSFPHQSYDLCEQSPFEMILSF